MCVFCKIVEGEIPCYKLYEDDEFLSFLDIGQATIGHCLVIPKKHFANIFEIDEVTLSKMIIIVKKIVKAVSLATNTTNINILNNNGEAAGQSVNHFHIHIIPRYENDNLQIVFSNNNLEKDQMDILKQSIINNLK